MGVRCEFNFLTILSINIIWFERDQLEKKKKRILRCFEYEKIYLDIERKKGIRFELFFFFRSTKKKRKEKDITP